MSISKRPFYRRVIAGYLKRGLDKGVRRRRELTLSGTFAFAILGLTIAGMPDAARSCQAARHDAAAGVRRGARNGKGGARSDWRRRRLRPQDRAADLRAAAGAGGHGTRAPPGWRHPGRGRQQHPRPGHQARQIADRGREAHRRRERPLTRRPGLVGSGFSRISNPPEGDPTNAQSHRRCRHPRSARFDEARGAT